MKLTDLSGHPSTTVAEQIAKSQEFLQMTDEELAMRAALPNPSMIAMIKKGTMRLPLGMVHQVAKALDVEPGTLMRLALEEMQPGLALQIEQCLGPLTLSAGEARLIMALRDQAKGRDVSPVMFSGDAVVAVLVT